LQERAMAMISIAHPDFREELFFEARKMGLLGAERSLSESLHGIYPIKLEETREIAGESITIRPAKPVDERRIQEHFYTLDKNDVVSRFFHDKTRFVHDEVKDVSQIDYIKTLTIVAVIGEFGFGKVIAIGEYHFEDATNMAEIAFSVSKNWQKKGLGLIFIRKLAEAARENGISGFHAYTAPDNEGMISLFKSLPYRTRTSFEGNVVKLTCRFDEIVS
jgi:RimJ/RimL family protein N-acetyltransferase